LLDDEHPHFVGAMGLETWFEGETTYGRAAIGELLCVPGTPYPRISVLATMVDLVAGMQPSGPINPTVDLRLQLTTLVPMSTVRLRCDVLRSGRRLFVGETRLYADDQEHPFGRSVVTFINRRVVFPPDGPVPSQRLNGSLRVRVEDLLDVRTVDDSTIEIDPIGRLSNGPGATLQGGVLALLGELATEHALGRSVFVTDLDVRYLNPVRIGPVQARAEVLADIPQEAAATVRIVDAGNADRLIAHVTTTARRL
jgi:acyl-coenzyme A thioesterase PaaI-like protein